MIGVIVQGKMDLADVFFLVSLILFCLEVLVLALNRRDDTRGVLMPLGLAFFVAGIFVL